MDRLFINHSKIIEQLANKREPERKEVLDILAKARELKGISPEEAGKLLFVENDETIDLISATAEFVKNEIYGKRVVLFAPLYISNMCSNECEYCAFKKSNTTITRRTLTIDEIRTEVESLVKTGHKRVLLVSGEGLGLNALDYTIKAIETIYSVKDEKNNSIRRINVNIAALPVEAYRKLKEAKIGTYQLFQETYHYETYKAMHKSGPKSNYEYHLTAMDRAMDGGIDDVGVGILFGLADYRFEIMALLQHIKHLEEKFGVGPHTISVPRIEPAEGSKISENPPNAVSDRDFRKIISILRLTVPYTGIILSTRENSMMRKEALSLGVSQLSAGSRTNPGGYSDSNSAEQFSLGDHRSLEEVIENIVDLGYIPSFCTGCYRMGRTGADFMDLAKPGLIKHYCLPNAITSFKEYLTGFGSPEIRLKGLGLIEKMIKDIPSESVQEKTKENLSKIDEGEKDLYL